MAIVISLDSSISATARPTRTFRSVRLVGQMYGKSSLTVLVNVARSRTERLSARTLEISGCRMDPRALVRSIWQAYRRFDLEPTLTPVTSHVDFSVYDQGKRRIGAGGPADVCVNAATAAQAHVVRDFGLRQRRANRSIVRSR